MTLEPLFKELNGQYGTKSGRTIRTSIALRLFVGVQSVVSFHLRRRDMRNTRHRTGWMRYFPIALLD
jgi:hypothetical protein